MSDVELAWAGEEALLAPETRHDPATVEGLLDPEFREIGQSGRLWDRDGIVAMLVEPADAEAGDAGQYVISERAAVELGEGVVLLMYRLVFDGRDSRRSSVWRVRDGRARISFHQGTSVPAG